MNIKDLINLKNKGQNLTREQTNFIVKAFTNKKISDEQMCELLKAIQKIGIDDKEIINLFASTTKYSLKIPLQTISGYKIDKHSTGGIGDSTTLILMPLLAALGLKSYKLSGRRLGHTSGTIDKISAFPNVKIDYSIDEFFKKAQNSNLALASPIEELSYFEKKVYYLRTLSKTTKNVGLIVNSIMIKKILLENDGLLMDVKIGSGSLFKNTQEIKHFVRLAKKIAKYHNRECRIIYTNMHQPLGKAIGTKIEIIEALKTMQGKGPEDLVAVVNELAVNALLMSKKFTDYQKASNKVQEVLNSGILLKHFKKQIKCLKGDWDYIWNHPHLKAKHKVEIYASKEGYVWIPDASKIGEFLNDISLNEKLKIDHESGIYWVQKNNDFVKKNQKVFTFYTNKININDLKEKSQKLFVIKQKPTKKLPTILNLE